MKKFQKQYTETKIRAREKLGVRENKSEGDELKDGCKKIDEIALGWKDIVKKTEIQSKHSQAFIEDGIVLSNALTEFGETCQTERVSVMLGGVICQVSSMQRSIEEIRSLLFKETLGEFSDPVNEYLHTEIKEAKAAKQNYDKVRIQHDAAVNKVKGLSRKKQVNEETLKEAEQELANIKQTFEETTLSTTNKVNETLANHEFTSLQLLVDYVKVYQSFFTEGLAAIQTILPTVEKSEEIIVALKEKYAKKQAGDGFVFQPPPKVSRMFTVPFKQFLEQQQTEEPTLMVNLIEYIREIGLETVGIFRISAVKTAILKLQERIENGEDPNFKAEETDLALATGLLKTYLRDLPEPLIPFSMYFQFEALSKNLDPSTPVLDQIKALFDQLPSENVTFLKRVLSLCHDIVLNQDVNKMTAGNLAVVLAPNLLYPDPEQVDEVTFMLEGTKHCNFVVDRLITVYPHLFPEHCQQTTGKTVSNNEENDTESKTETDGLVGQSSADFDADLEQMDD